MWRKGELRGCAAKRRSRRGWVQRFGAEIGAKDPSAITIETVPYDLSVVRNEGVLIDPIAHRRSLSIRRRFAEIKVTFTPRHMASTMNALAYQSCDLFQILSSITVCSQQFCFDPAGQFFSAFCHNCHHPPSSIPAMRLSWPTRSSSAPDVHLHIIVDKLTLRNRRLIGAWICANWSAGTSRGCAQPPV